MAKQLNYVLNFNADTAKARQEMQGLQKQLDELTRVASKPAGGSGLTAEFQEAAKAAAMLKAQVEGAMNTRTGTLDLGMLNQSFKQAGVSLQSYQSKLTKLGPEGVKTFQAIAQSILSAEVPLRRSNGMLTEFATTLKNTARWQLSSSILHGFMGTLQSAYGYAKDLNESLNNIRIVTGYSTDQMASFAAEANKAAQALNTTTTNYTDAALIYYQQGLSDDVVKARTDTTIKFANVARESADVASQELTAIWNNFADGADNLDYYADVLVKLGATTASSSQEISAGLQKFAAISDTIGLSYEYAAAALATVTATTRQSADVVGTAFKTLFSRLEGLQLGETLEDGTDLNKYSAALSAVGIQIKDTNGDLKDMDVILDELGGRWDTLSRDQQMALAQTVAGVRQYTQLVALMDNWDFFQENVATARGAGGALDEQAEIYAESWEAARKRVKAAAEEIYNALLNDDFFIGLNNGFAGFLGIISNVIQGLGGLKGVLAGLGAAVTQIFGDQMAASIDRFFSNLQGKEAVALQMRQQALNALQASAGTEMGEAYASLVEPQQALINNASKLSAQEKAIAQTLIQQQQYRVNSVEAAQRDSTLAQERLATAVKETQQVAAREGVTRNQRQLFDGITKQAQQAVPEVNKLKNAITEAFNILDNKSGVSGQKILQLRELFSGFDMSKLPKDIQTMVTELNSGTFSLEQFRANLEKMGHIEMGGVGDAFRKALMEAAGDSTVLQAKVEEIVNALNNGETAAQRLAQALKVAKEGGQLTAEQIRLIAQHGQTIGQVFVQAGQGISSLAMVLTSIQGISRTLANEDMSTMEKFTSILMSLGILIPVAISGIKSLISVGAALPGLGTKIAMSMAMATGETEAFAAGMIQAQGAAHVFAASLWEVLAPILPIIAAAGVLVGVIYSVVKEYNSANEAARQAEQTAEDLADAAQEASNKLSSIKSAVEGYDSVVDKLNACTRGTEEWNTTLAEAKGKIDEILTAYPELLKYKDLFTDDGLLNEDVLDQFIENQEKAAEAAQVAASRGQAQAAQARLEADTVAAERKYTPNYYNPTHDASSNKSIRQDLDSVLKYIDDIDASAATLADVYDVLGDVNEDYAYEILSLAQKSMEASNIMENANKQMIQTWADSKNKKLLQGQAEIMSRMQTDLQEQLTADAERARAYNLRLADGFTGTSYEGKSIAEAFQQAIGSIEPVDLSEYTNEQITSTIAAAAALERLGASADTAADVLNNLKDNASSEGIAKGIADYIATGSFGSMSEKDFKQMQKDAGAAGGWTEYLKNMTGLDETGLSNILGEDYLKGVYNAVDSYGQGLQELTNNLSSSVESAYNELKANNTDIEAMAPDQRTGVLKTLSRAEEQGGAAGLNQAKELIGSVDSSDLESLSQVLNNMNWDTQGPRDFADAIAESGIKTDVSREKLIALGKVLSTLATDAEAVASKIAELREEIAGLEGSTIDDSMFNGLLDALGSEGVKEFVTTLSSGAHILTGDIEQLNNALATAQAAPFLEQLQQLQQPDAIKGAINSGLEQQITQLSEQYNTLRQAREEAEQAGNIGYLTETANQYRDLEAALRNTAETYGQFNVQTSASMTEAAASALNAAESFKQFEDIYLDVIAIDASDGFINTNFVAAGAEALLRLADNYENCADEAEDFKRALAEGDEVAQRTAMDALMLAEYAGELGNEFELSGEEIQNYARQLKESGEYMEATDKALIEMAKDQLRYDRALESAADHMEDWQAALAKASKTGHVAADVIDEIKDTYGDLLDIDGSLLSDQFATNADNLALMQDAINGNEAAYEQLQQMAQQEIEAQVGITMDDTDFWNKKSEVQAAMDAMNFEDIEVGASLDDAGFLQALSDMVNAAGMSAAQAQAYLSTMGIDAEVVEDTTTDTETNEIPAYHTVGRAAHAPYNIPTITASSSEDGITVQQGPSVTGVASYPYFESVPDNQTQTSQKESKSFALKVVSANKSAGGNIKHKKSNSAGGGGGGGGKGKKGCFVAGTPITTKHGLLPIEQIRVGDIVLSYNERTQLNEYSQVLETMIHIVFEPIYTLVTENEILEVTGNHRLYIERNNQYLWLPVEELTLSDKVRYASGKFHAIDSIFMTEVRATAVYNFEVSNNHNYYVGKSKILAHNKGGGGGGGGGQAKPHQAAAVGQKLEKPKRYQKVDQALTNSKRNMDRLNETTDRAFGTKKLEKFEKQIELLNKDTEILNDKLKEIGDTTSGYLAEDLADLKTQFKDLNIPIEIDSEGFVTNFEDLSRAAVNAYNQVALAYEAWDKSMQGVDENSDAYKNAKEQWDRDLEVAKDRYEKQMESIDQWQETWNLKQDTIDEIADNARGAFDKALEGVKYKMDVRLEVKDAYDQIRDFEKTLAESFGDAITHGLKTAAIDYQQVSAEMGMVQYFREESEELQKLLSEATDASSIEDIKDAMLDLQGNILDSAEAMLDWIDMVENMVPDAVEAARDRFDQFLDQLDHNSTILDTIKELMALQGQTYRTQAGFANLQKVAQEQMKTAIADAVLNRKWFEEAEQRLAQAQADLEGVAEDDVRYDYLKNRRDAYLEEFNASQEAYLESAQEAMEIAKDMYLEQIQQAIYEFGKAVSGDALDFAAQKFDHFIDTEGRYLDTVNKAYQQQMWATKIQADYDKDILGTHRDLIKAFEQEYNALFNRTRVNEYDLKILEARYKVMEATMALQDAENAKNNLRLVRDRQGNWNYQFTADQGAVAEAEQQQAEAQNEWYNIAKEQTEQVTSDIVQLWQDSADAIQEIFEDEELTEEEKWERIAEVEEYYTQKAADLYGDRTQAYNDLVEAGKLSIDDFKTTYADTLVEMTGNANDYETALNDTINNCKDHFNEYQANIKQVASESHTDLDNLKQDVDKVSESTEKLKTKGQECADALYHTIDEIDSTANSYSRLFDAVQNCINALREMASIQAGTVAAVSGMTDYASNYYASAALVKSLGDDAAAEFFLGGRPEAYTARNGAAQGWKEDVNTDVRNMTEDAQRAAEYGAKYVAEETFDYLDRYGYNTTELRRKAKEQGIGMATGGYTGEWGASGKLAFLHEKELVLNKEDTENILAAVGIIRSIESALDSRALTMQGQMISMLSGYTPTIPQTTSDKTVTNYFDVAFPNATSSSEIEEALRNLANNADQWAERRDR